MAFSDDEIDKAFEEVDNSMKNLGNIADRALKKLSKKVPLEDIYIFPENINTYRVIVFFKTEDNKREYYDLDINEILNKVLYKFFKKYKKVSAKEIELIYEFDSHENVIANYHGDYGLRLR